MLFTVKTIIPIFLIFSWHQQKIKFINQIFNEILDNLCFYQLISYLTLFNVIFLIVLQLLLLSILLKKIQVFCNPKNKWSKYKLKINKKIQYFTLSHCEE